MTRNTLLIGFLAVSALAVVLAGTAAGGSDAVTVSSLADQIRTQSGATEAALAVANDIWVPRIAGLGIGLAVGLLGGGFLTYLNRGESR